MQTITKKTTSKAAAIFIIRFETIHGILAKQQNYLVFYTLLFASSGVISPWGVTILAHEHMMNMNPEHELEMYGSGMIVPCSVP